MRSLTLAVLATGPWSGEVSANQANGAATIIAMTRRAPAKVLTTMALSCFVMIVLVLDLVVTAGTLPGQVDIWHQHSSNKIGLFAMNSSIYMKHETD